MDFEACYKLLASRPAHAHEHCVGEQHDAHHEEDVQAVADAVAEDLTPSESAAATTSAEELPQRVAELGRTFFSLQERRVQIYSEFQTGFNTFKATPQFQPFCTTITALFADVSKQVNAIEAALRAQQRTPLAQLIRKVQVQEKEKLLLTSALLVEKMRLTDMAQRAEPDESRLALLEKSVAAMTASHTDILVQINELLDELRMELADEQEDE